MTEQELRRALKRASPEMQAEFTRSAIWFGIKSSVGLALLYIGGAGVLWLAPWWAKFLVPMLWGIQQMLTQQIATGLLMARVDASARLDQED